MASARRSSSATSAATAASCAWSWRPPCEPREPLRELGHATRIARDGVEALQLVEHFEPELALLDIGLPVMDGYELAERLRQRFPASSLRLVAITGYGQESDRKRIREAGFDGHLVKPVDVTRLQGLIRELATTITR